ncbi:cyclin-D3-3-like [Wolffia australiana]
MASFHHLAQARLFQADPLSCYDEHIDFFPLWEEDEDQPSNKPVAEDGLWDWEWRWEEEEGEEEEKAELAVLLSKQAALAADPSLVLTRESAVQWIVSSCGRHGFNTQTALLAVNYLDRFLSSAVAQQPWMAQLSAVACLSLAAKMEEIRVPLLLDLQAEDAKFVFEPRTVQRMELLVLSSLGWRLGLPTPLSFIDHFLRRLAAVTGRHHGQLHCKLQATCHSLLLKLVAHQRWVEFLPSVMAVATMVHAIGLLLDHPLAVGNLRNRLVALAGLTKEEVESCGEFIVSIAGDDERRRKRRAPSPASPRGVVEVTFSDDMSPAPSQPGSVTSSPTAAKRLKPLSIPGGVFI